MASGTTRLALANIQNKGRAGNAQHEEIEEVLLEKIEDKVGGKPGKQKKQPLRDSTKTNHSFN